MYFKKGRIILSNATSGPVHKSGYVTIIGRPNVGKSTLTNAIIGQKIAITSDKPQTTRNRILTILTEPDAQIVMLDTPGVHKPISKLGEYMARAVESTLNEVDAIIFLVDVTEKTGGGERYIIERLKKAQAPVILAINKIDLIPDPGELLPIMESYSRLFDFAAIVPISASTGSNLKDLLEEIKKLLPEGPRYYPADMVTDQPERLIAGEMIREQVLRLTHDEVPHAVAVEVSEMKTRPTGDVFIRATIFVERETQKGIIIGKAGSLLKQVGAGARREIEALLGSRVYLDLWVKVKKDWRNKSGMLKSLGLTSPDPAASLE